MTVRELINELQNHDPNAEVGYAYNYGDYWSTQVVGEIEMAEPELCEYSDYHNMNKIADEQDDEEEQTTIVVLKG